MNEIRKMVALGSSFAAGPGIDPIENPDAMRSSRNYAHLLAARLRAELVDLSVSGATTATILHTPQLTANGVEFAPQIDGVPPDADLVTVTAGGNDLGFAGSMLYAAWARHQPSSEMATLLAPAFAGGIPEPTRDSTEQVAAGLAEVVSQVRLRAANARIVLVDYLTVIDPQDHIENSPFPAGETAAFLRIQNALAEGYLRATQRSGAALLSASALSAHHGLGTKTPWVFAFQPVMDKTGSSFHPNETGMRAIADALADRLSP